MHREARKGGRCTERYALIGALELAKSVREALEGKSKKGKKEGAR